MTIRYISKEFKVNEFITLKLENEKGKRKKTFIYVKGRRFRQCLFLLINIPFNRIKSFEHVVSIDESIETLDDSMEIEEENNYINNISPEDRFWGHCSNLQLWIERNYDTRFLHSNLAFPLLKELVDAGDLKANKVFKHEIATRFSSGYPPVMEYLLREGYLNYLNKEELTTLLQENEIHYVTYKNNICGIVINNRLDLRRKQISDLNDVTGLSMLNSLKTLILSNNQISSIPDFFLNLTSLQFLDLSYNRFKFFPEKLAALKSLEILYIGENKIKTIPDSIQNFKSLKMLSLASNKLSKIPESITNLPLLEDLTINFNFLISLPESIGNLKLLKRLRLSGNRLNSLPDSISNLDSLEELDIGINQFVNLPKSLLSLPSLKRLNTNFNKINKKDPVKNQLSH